MPVKNVVRGQKVSHKLHERAKELRHEMTPVEKILWKHLRTNKLNGIHFRRQQVVFGYLADFYCHQHALIVEVDGDVHDLQKEYDAERENYLIAHGPHILRFRNEEITNNLDQVLMKIVEECKET